MYKSILGELVTVAVSSTDDAVFRGRRPGAPLALDTLQKELQPSHAMSF